MREPAVCTGRGYHRPSRFIGELPQECVEEVRLRATVSRPVNHQRLGAPIAESDTGYKLGQRVRHPKFGEGTIVNSKAAASTADCRWLFRARESNGWWRLTPGWRQCNFKKNIIICNILLPLYVKAPDLRFRVPLRVDADFALA
ncbi:DNA-dependent helicase II [Klebsiella pneumoniae]|uniref:DNA-dependent helicase II n=1 Tax=Klebsiella pneumoniae TaxID=573 RepID=A0A2X3CUA2_KLEPN|nr:DNA-dependent helicase II [Klebsiella pneumoniae]